MYALQQPRKTCWPLSTSWPVSGSRKEKALLDQRDSIAKVEESASGGEPGEAASDYHAVARRRMGRRLCSHNRTISRSFSLSDRDTRLA